MRITMPSGRVYEVVNESNKPDCVGTLRVVDAGDASNSNAPVYRWPK